ncbi:hypothetical protein BUALT_Bualt01G0109800 [Buddleja alternifolia]|uniref:Protein kinase domain-containing protein n=1 Tax=Buddleja alternifolia TaxID=168488 RepID=A0AAV6YH06_9LAMI|nr:hypothetical protein BUALT_Bualt01G0109800 [Buddleja alternifolia]
MNCFPCFQSKEKNSRKEDELPVAQAKYFTSPPPPVSNNLKAAPLAEGNRNSEDGGAKTFTFRELATAAKNFRQECLLGEGGFGRVFKGTLLPSGETIAIRQLDRNGAQGSKEFTLEISKLSLLHHPNLVKIIGYCADGDQRLLVYEYMPSGSLKNHLFNISGGQKALDWSTRMKIALGIAEGLEFLHEKTVPPIVYHDLKSSNILLDATNNPRLSEYGLAMLVQSSNSMLLSPTVMASYGYCAPEYERRGELTSKSDVYSFGVVLLELITGRKAMDTTKPQEEQNLVSWAQPIFHDPTRFPDMADPLLRKQFPVTSLNQAVGVAAMCLQEEPSARPFISDISAALSFLAMAPPETPIPARLLSILSTRISTSSQCGDNMNSIRESNVGKQDSLYISDSCYSSDSYDDEEEKRNEYQNNNGRGDMSQSEFNESKKLGSSSKRKSKTEIFRGSSDASRDYSVGYSLRCDTSFPERSDLSNSTREFQDEDDSYSDEEPLNRRSHGKSVGINSRNRSRKDSRKKVMSSKERQVSIASSGFYSSSEDEDITPRQYDRSNHGSEFVYSKSSSIMDPDTGLKDPDKGNLCPGSGAADSVQKVKSAIYVDSVQKVKPGIDMNSVQKVKSAIDRNSVRKI